MTHLVVYRLGERYTLDRVPGAEPVTLALADGVTIGQAGMGTRLLHSSRPPHWLTLESGMSRGWCWVADEGALAEDAEPDAPSASGSRP